MVKRNCLLFSRLFIAKYKYSQNHRKKLSNSVLLRERHPVGFLRHELWRRGFRYRVNDRRLPGSPDVVLPRYRTVVFVHGCFWHGHKGCSKYTVPKTNTEFWTAKVARNQARDQEVWRKLEAHGWAVVIVWECELDKAHLADTIDRVSSEIIHNGELLLASKAARRASRTDYLLTRRALSIRESAHLAELKDSGSSPE